MTDFLAAQGYHTSARKSIPVVAAKLPPSVIRAIANRTDVATIYRAGSQAAPQLDVAIPTEYVPEVWATGIDGSGIDIAILEAGVVGENPYLNVIARHETATPDDHATWVASAAASNHSTWRGVAYQADIISANYTGNDIEEEEALQWALDQGADVVNISEVFDSYSDDDDLHVIDQAMDYIIRRRFVTIVAVAGNMDYGNHIGSPAKAYGVITVGAFNDLNMPHWTGDQMWDLSAWKNPRISYQREGDREKPEVVAAGENVITLGIDGNPEYLLSGTSLAAPQVAGLAALMMNQNKALVLWPETVKAIIMASAVHNIEGTSVIRQDGIDDKDGAGAIVATHAVRIAALRSTENTSCSSPCWWAESINSSNFPVGTYRYYDFIASAGDRVRVAIAWHSNASSDYMTDALDTNLDLLVIDPDWQILDGIGGYSASWDNNYEIVEFDAPKTGAYHIGVHKFSAEEASNWLGVAWTRVKPYDATYLSHTTPGPVFPDQDYQVCFDIRNDGYLEWPVGGSNPVRLGYHWYDLDGQEVSTGADYRTNLLFDLPQGDITRFCGQVRTPANLGRYTLKWDMVHEGVAWFAERGDTPLATSVTVTDVIFNTYLPLVLRD